MDKRNRELLSEIAHEAHMMGRIYNKLGGPERPSEVYDKIEQMVANKLRCHLSSKSSGRATNCSCGGRFVPDNDGGYWCERCRKSPAADLGVRFLQKEKNYVGEIS